MGGLLRRMALVLSVVTALVVATNSWAGSSQPSGPPQLDAERVADFSKRLEGTLAQSGARVAIVSRAGRPEHQLPKGVQYTHVAFAVYSQVTLDNGTVQPGYAMYNLYQTPHKPDRSQLVQDYPFDFFSAVPTLKAGIIIPKLEVQQRLLRMITSPSYKRLHNAKYSVIANPLNNQLQNCTEFTLNVVQAALYDRSDMGYIKRSLADHFQPTVVNVNPLKLMAGAAFAQGVSLRDHDSRVQTATFGSIAEYFERYGLADKIMQLTEQEVSS